MSFARAALTLTAIAMVAAGCSAGRAGPTTSLAAAGSTTAPTSTTTTTTTTTTTLPPGLAAQTLEYGFADRAFWSYDVSSRVDVEMAASGPRSIVGSVSDFELETTVEGSERILILPSTEPGAFQVIPDFHADYGEVTVTSGTSSFTEEITGYALRDFDGGIPSAVMDRQGELVDAPSGTPSLHRLGGVAADLVLVVGPPLPDEPVDVGDSWTATLQQDYLAETTIDVEILDEIVFGSDEQPDGSAGTSEPDAPYVFVLGFSGGIDEPVELTLDEANDILAASGTDTDLLQAVFGTTGDIETTVTITDLTVEGQAQFDPVAGVVMKLTGEIRATEEIEISVDGKTVTISVTLTSQEQADLVSNEPAGGFEVTRTLEQFETDPQVVAELGLSPLFMLPVVDDDYNLVSPVLRHVGEQGAAFPGASWLTVELDDASTTLVVSLANGGPLRGNPYLAETIAGIWGDRSPSTITVGDHAMYRTSVDDREWLVWADATNTYIAVGPRPSAGALLELVADASRDPYLWKTGDCIIGENADDLPYAPVGTYGLSHCNARHSFEVIHAEALPEAANAEYPDDLGSRAAQACGAAFVDYIGAYPLETEVALARFIPDPEEWKRGARYLACVAYVAEGGGVLQIDTWLQGAAADHPVTLTAGDCELSGVPVPCSVPHDGEVLAMGEYDAPAAAAYPDLGDLSDEVDQECLDETAEIEFADGDFEIAVVAMSDMALGWGDGVRSYYCVAYALDDDGMPVEIAGSFTGDWGVAEERVDA